MSTTYVIVTPGGWGHVSTNPKAHLVVDVEEWVKVYHKEKAAYDSVIEHASYQAAHEERDRLNGVRDTTFEPQPEVAVEDPHHGVQWLGLKVAS